MIAETGRFEWEAALPAPAPAWTGGWPQTPEAFERLVEACQDRLVAYAFRRLGDLTEAEDAVQEVFVNAYASRRKRLDVANVVAYLYRMTGNLCTDFQRRRGIRQAVSLEEARVLEIPAAGPDGAQLAAAAEEAFLVEARLARIPQPQAEAIRLCVLAELTAREAGEVLGCPEATVKSRVRYGLEKLREIITQEREEAR